MNPDQSRGSHPGSEQGGDVLDRINRDVNTRDAAAEQARQKEEAERDRLADGVFQMGAAMDARIEAKLEQAKQDKATDEKAKAALDKLAEQMSAEIDARQDLKEEQRRTYHDRAKARIEALLERQRQENAAREALQEITLEDIDAAFDKMVGEADEKKRQAAAAAARERMRNTFQAWSRKEHDRRVGPTIDITYSELTPEEQAIVAAENVEYRDVSDAEVQAAALGVNDAEAVQFFARSEQVANRPDEAGLVEGRHEWRKTNTQEVRRLMDNNELSPERKTELMGDLSILEQEIAEDKEEVKKLEASLEKALGMPIDAAREKMMFSRWESFKFGLRSLFNRDLRRAIDEYDTKNDALNNKELEAGRIRLAITDPRQAAELSGLRAMRALTRSKRGGTGPSPERLPMM